MTPQRFFSTPLAAALLCGMLSVPASAQFDNQWLEYFNATSARLGPAATEVSNNNIEVDFAWDDLDQDGWVDLVVVRKQPFTSTGKRTNMLLMNENGVLVDRTAVYASDSDEPGDQGFLTPTNDRDVVIVDVDNDGLLDVVTATTLSDGDPKAIGHPRIYMNKGFDVNNAWLGLRFEAARTPQFFHFGNGSMQNPRFCSVSAGDVTGDGFADLYFGDYDSGMSSSSSNDLNDRLLVNDGNGFFADESQLRMTDTMLKSAFGTAVEIIDMNLDGLNDIVKDTALNSPTYVSVSLNDPSNVGFFNLFDAFNTSANYHVDAGDLNNDGRPDVVISDDGSDRVRYNLSNNVLGIPQWGPARQFQFLSGGDDGFGSNNLIVDLDGDGWNDIIICDVDVDIGGCGRRVHIYHNPGGAVGSEIVLLEERQTSGAGWIGAVGLTQGDLTGGHDVAIFDIDNDGDMDMVLGRCSGTFVWENDSEVCQPNLGFGGPGSTRLRVCGDELATGGTAEAIVYNGPPNTPVLLVAGLVSSPTPLLGGMIVPVPPTYLFPLATDVSGTATLPGIPGGNGPASLFVQAAAFDPSLPDQFAITNAIQIDFLP